MNGADFLVDALVRSGTKMVFGYPGGAILPVYDALTKAPLRHILCRHEQGAALAANGYARATGKPGVCMATSGPGATNLITGVADAYADSVPLVVITGQVPTTLMGTDAFQEIDIIGMSMPIVKHGFQPASPSALAEAVAEAFHLATTGRPGPVWIDIPKDVMLAEIPAGLPTRLWEVPNLLPDSTLIARAKDLLANSRCPVVYAGGGVAMAGAVDELRAFVTHTGIPTVTTLKGIGCLDAHHPAWLGMVGMHGTKAANQAVQGCDLLIVAGARLDDRATGKLAEFAPNAAVIHLDIDPSELGKLRNPAVGITGDLRVSLQWLQQTLSIADWQNQCRQWKSGDARSMLATPQTEGQPINPPRLLRKLSAALPQDCIVTCDVGQHQMWVAQHWQFNRPEHHLTSGGLGTMGFGLPAAIGAQLAHPRRTVLNVTGDGSIVMNIQELATIGRYRLPIKILLFDNHRLGMVRQWQELFYARRYSEVDLSDNPDFTSIAHGFGIPARRVGNAAGEDELIDLLRHTQGPLLIHAVIAEEDNVWPLVPPGQSNAVMMEGVQT